MSSVRVSVSLTLQLAPYQTERIGIEWELDCEKGTEQETEDELFELLSASIIHKADDLRDKVDRAGLI